MKSLLLLIALCSTCSPPKGMTFEGRIVTSGTPCQRACTVLAHYNCLEATPNEKGMTCVQVCDRVTQTEYASLPVDCIIDATSKGALQKECKVCR